MLLFDIYNHFQNYLYRFRRSLTVLAERCFDPIADEFLDDYYYITPSISQQHLLAKLLQGGIINNLKQLTINEDFSAIVELFRCYLPNNRIQTLIVYQKHMDFDLLTDVTRLFNSFKNVTDLRLSMSSLIPCEISLIDKQQEFSMFHKLEQFKLETTFMNGDWHLLQHMMT